MKRFRIPPETALAILLLCGAVAVLAASAPEMPRQVTAAGGGWMRYGGIEQTVTAGQPVLGNLVHTGRPEITLRSGFWQPIAHPSAAPGTEIPQKPMLIGNTPNPFNPMTEIRFAVGREAAHARLRIYDVQGRLVHTLVDESVPPGIRRAVWQGETDRGGKAATGVYFYRLEVGDEVFTQKMLLLK